MVKKVLRKYHHNAIRGLIAPDITEVHISDEYLLQLPFVPAAEKEVRRRLAADGIDVDTLTSGILEDAVLAMIHQCAALLCITAPQLLRQTALQVSAEIQRIDWKEKRAFHLSEVDKKINDVKSKFGTEQPETVDAQRSRLNPFRAVGTKRRDDEAVCPISRRM